MTFVLASNQTSVAPSQGQIIRDALLGRLQRGEMGLEDRLVDTAVAAEFGVSRMPARDALKAMLKSGGPTPPAPFDGLEVLRPAADYKNRHASILLSLDAAAEATLQAQQAHSA